MHVQKVNKYLVRVLAIGGDDPSLVLAGLFLQFFCQGYFFAWNTTRAIQKYKCSLRKNGRHGFFLHQENVLNKRCATIPLNANVVACLRVCMCIVYL